MLKNACSIDDETPSLTLWMKTTMNSSLMRWNMFINKLLGFFLWKLRTNFYPVWLYVTCYITRIVVIKTFLCVCFRSANTGEVASWVTSHRPNKPRSRRREQRNCSRKWDRLAYLLYLLAVKKSSQGNKPLVLLFVTFLLMLKYLMIDKS